MNLKIGDQVTRISHEHDILFKIVGFEGDIVFLKGVDLRLVADSYVDDLVKVLDHKENDDKSIIEKNVRDLNIDRSQYFYLPGKILHIDGDNDYLERCMKFYEDMNVKANGIALKEIEMPNKILALLEEFQPDIVVVTGHDAYYSKKDDMKDNNNYQNTINFIDAVKVARKYEKSHDKLIIIAGANFASSPKRINIHALDPAIIASSLALSDRNKSIDLIHLIEKTKYGKDGIGGIITNGTMYVGYPR